MLPLKVINVKFLQEYISSFEIKVGEKCWKFVCFYRSPSQTHDEFETFLKQFELNLNKIHENNPFMTYVLGDFNEKFNSWFKNDTTSLEDSMIDAVTNKYGLHEAIQEATHLLDSSSSCIDLSFSS